METIQWELELPDETLPASTRTSVQQVGAVNRRNILLTEDGDFDLMGGLKFSSGLTAIKQSLRCRLQAIRGEWFRNVLLGLPLFTDIIGKSPNLAAIRGLYRATIEETPGVLEITELRLSLSSDRELEVSFRCSTDFGELIDTVPIPPEARP